MTSLNTNALARTHVLEPIGIPVHGTATQQSGIRGSKPAGKALARKLRRQKPVYSQDAALAIAASVEVEPQPTEIERFCAALSCYQGRFLREVHQELEALPLPTGFLHVRLLVQGDDVPFCWITRRDRLPVDAFCIAMSAARDQMKTVSWSQVEALDVVHRGVLDLALTYDVLGS